VGLNGLQFDVAELSPPFTYDKYLQAMREASASRAYDVLVIDSLTHVWAGEGGALEQVDAVKRRNGNAFTAWGDVTPDHNKLLSAITSSPVHLICTVRSKTAYALEERENRNGKVVQTPVKVGLAPVQRDGIEYEFSVTADIDLQHVVTISKTRITELDGVKFQPNQLSDIGRMMRAFHETGEVPAGARPGAQDAARYERYWALFKNSSHVGQPVADLDDEALDAYIERLNKAVASPGKNGDYPYKADAEKYLEVAKRLFFARVRPATSETDEWIPYDSDTGEVLTDDVHSKSAASAVAGASAAAKPDDRRGGRVSSVGTLLFSADYPVKKLAGKSAEKATKAQLVAYIAWAEAEELAGDAIEPFRALLEQLMAEEHFGGGNEDAAQ
jgi:hypothetical protein